MAPLCRHNTCSADNRRCGLCIYNPKKRCTHGCNIAVKQIQKHRLEAPCQAQVKVALYTAQACDAEASALSWPPSSAEHDLSSIYVQVGLNNIDFVLINHAQHKSNSPSRVTQWQVRDLCWSCQALCLCHTRHTHFLFREPARFVCICQYCAVLEVISATQFSLLNGNLHDSQCQALDADGALDTAQLQQCEVLTSVKQVSRACQSRPATQRAHCAASADLCYSEHTLTMARLLLSSSTVYPVFNVV